MTNVQEFVTSFESLPTTERQEVLVELLRRVQTESHDLASDEDLTAVADTLFLELDKRERGT
ncbi:MAG: hypothetical protein KC917_18480 [Candidatus Omnitrophica bacterium]|nr:hypothetical protein [Candidatus Omnitrophota bacterium]